MPDFDLIAFLNGVTVASVVYVLVIFLRLAFQQGRRLYVRWRINRLRAQYLAKLSGDRQL